MRCEHVVESAIFCDTSTTLSVAHNDLYEFYSFDLRKDYSIRIVLRCALVACDMQTTAKKINEGMVGKWQKKGY